MTGRTITIPAGSWGEDGSTTGGGGSGHYRGGQPIGPIAPEGQGGAGDPAVFVGGPPLARGQMLRIAPGVWVGAGGGGSGVDRPDTYLRLPTSGGGVGVTPGETLIVNVGQRKEYSMLTFRVRFERSDQPATAVDFPRRQEAIEHANSLLRTDGIKSLSCVLVTLEDGVEVETPIEWMEGV